MSVPRGLSIRWLMGLTVLVAANVAFFQFVSCFTWPDLWPQVVPMGLALQLAALIVWRQRNRGRPNAFWVGFVVGGGLAWFMFPTWWYMSHWMWIGDDLFWRWGRGPVEEVLSRAIDRWHGPGWAWPDQLRFYETYSLAIEAVCWGLPLLAIGVIGGVGAWAAGRLSRMAQARHWPRGRAEATGG